MRETNKVPIVWKGILFDSLEEKLFAMWLEELKENGVVKYWFRELRIIQITAGIKVPYVKQTQLKTKLKLEVKSFTLLRPSEYTPDFEVTFNMDFWGKIVSPPHESKLFNKDAVFFSSYYDKPTLVEIKPSFDQNNMERLFVLNQKFIWDKFKIFVNLIEPVELFKNTFLPLQAIPFFQYKVIPKKAALKGKKKGDFKFDWTPKTIKQYIDDLENKKLV